jgi:protease-4
LVTAVNHGRHDIAAAMAVFGNNVAGGFNVLYRTLLSVLVVVVSSGCTRWRFVVEAVPSDDKLTETEVLRDPGAGTSAAKIALIDVKGMIVNAERGRILGRIENPVARFTESLRIAEEDSKVKAVIIRINSPGGTVTASDIMYREVLDFKERSSKPVIVLMDEVAASGGYYLSCAGDEIIAYPSTVTGSIGVIIQTFNFSGGMAKIGIKADAITSGPNKAVGSPFEPMSREHRALLQGIVDEFYANFVDIVVENRPTLSPDDLAQITDGRVVTGARAVEVGIVDRLGDLRTAFAASKRHANISRARLVKYHRPLEYVGSPYAAAPAAPAGSQVNLIQLNMPTWPYENTGFYYLWDPTAW